MLPIPNLSLHLKHKLNSVMHALQQGLAPADGLFALRELLKKCLADTKQGGWDGSTNCLGDSGIPKIFFVTMKLILFLCVSDNGGCPNIHISNLDWYYWWVFDRDLPPNKKIIRQGIDRVYPLNMGMRWCPPAKCGFSFTPLAIHRFCRKSNCSSWIYNLKWLGNWGTSHSRPYRKLGASRVSTGCALF